MATSSFFGKVEPSNPDDASTGEGGANLAITPPITAEQLADLGLFLIGGGPSKRGRKGCHGYKPCQLENQPQSPPESPGRPAGPRGSRGPNVRRRPSNRGRSCFEVYRHIIVPSLILFVAGMWYLYKNYEPSDTKPQGGSIIGGFINQFISSETGPQNKSKIERHLKRTLATVPAPASWDNKLAEEMRDASWKDFYADTKIFGKLAEDIRSSLLPSPDKEELEELFNDQHILSEKALDELRTIYNDYTDFINGISTGVNSQIEEIEEKLLVEKRGALLEEVETGTCPRKRMTMEPTYAPRAENLYRQFWNETEASWSDLKAQMKSFYDKYELNHCADLTATLLDLKDDIAAGLTHLDKTSLVPFGMAYYFPLSSERSNLTSLPTFICQAHKKIQQPCERAKLTVEKTKQYEVAIERVIQACAHGGEAYTKMARSVKALIGSTDASDTYKAARSKILLEGVKRAAERDLIDLVEIGGSVVTFRSGN